MAYIVFFALIWLSVVPSSLIARTLLAKRGQTVPLMRAAFVYCAPDAGTPALPKIGLIALNFACCAALFYVLSRLF